MSENKTKTHEQVIDRPDYKCWQEYILLVIQSISSFG